MYTEDTLGSVCVCVCRRRASAWVCWCVLYLSVHTGHWAPRHAVCYVSVFVNVIVQQILEASIAELKQLVRVRRPTLMRRDVQHSWGEAKIVWSVKRRYATQALWLKRTSAMLWLKVRNVSQEVSTHMTAVRCCRFVAPRALQLSDWLIASQSLCVIWWRLRWDKLNIWILIFLLFSLSYNPCVSVH